MRKLLTALLLTVVLCSSLPSAGAQEADMAYFASFHGLNRVVARSWAAPMVVVLSPSETVRIYEGGTPQAATPVSATPAATPVASPASGSDLGMLSIFVFLFDSDDNAAAGWERIDADLQKTIRLDSRAPMTDDVPLDDVGDQARGYMGDLAVGPATITHTFATVQDGPFVYSLSGMFTGDQGATLTRDYAGALTAAPMDRMTEQYNQDGTSRGGIWHKLNAVQPDLPDESTITDFIVYPTEATPIAGLDAKTYTMQSGNLANIEGLQDAHGVTYQRSDGMSTPDPDQTGIFQVEAWIMSFDSVQDASNAVSPLANSLAYRIQSSASSNSLNQSNDVITTSAMQSGPIIDNALPAGQGTIHIRQEDTTVYALAIFATDEIPSSTATELVQQMINTPASEESEATPVDGTAEGGVWARFPEATDPLLGGTLPVQSVHPVGGSPATPASVHAIPAHRFS